MADDEEKESSSSELSVTPGSSWDSFFAECDSRFGRNTESPLKQNNDLVTRMPYQKATCFGVAPLDNARYLRLMKCNQCNRILKHVGYAHHMRRRHLCQPYDQNGSNSADEAPDFLLSPPYTNSALNAIYKQPSTSTANPMSYVSEKRDGLLLVLKRTRMSSESNNIEGTSNHQEIMEEPHSPDKLLSPTKRAQRSNASRLQLTTDPDSVALRTRSRHPETTYVELPTPTRQHRQSLTIPKITLSHSPKSKETNSRRNSRAGSPDSVIILDDDSVSKQEDDESRQSVYDSEPIEFSFVLPDSNNFAHDDQSNSLPPTNAMSDPHSSRSSSIQSLHPPSKDSRASSKPTEIIEASPEIICEEVEAEEMDPEEFEEEIEEEELEEEFTHSSMDYQNDNSLPSSSSPEMPKLERQDLYPQVDDSNGTDTNTEAVYYSANPGVFPPGTLVFAPSVHNPHQQHPVFNGTALHPVSIVNSQQNQSSSTSTAHVQTPQQTQSNGQQQLTFFYNPTAVINNSEPPEKKPARLVCKQQPRKKVATMLRGGRVQDQFQQLKRKPVTAVGIVNKLNKATSIHHLQPSSTQQPQRRVFTGPVNRLTAQQLSLLNVSTKPQPGPTNHRQQKLPPPIIITNPNSKKPNMLQQQRQRNYSPVVYFNGRPNSSPSSANSSGGSSNSYVSAKPAEAGWINNIHFNSNEFLYYNEPSSMRTQHLDLWKSSKGFLETRDQR